MAFLAKPDYFGLATTHANALTLKTSSENKTANTAEALNEHGDVVAQEVFGEQASPSVTYELKADISLSNIKLGEITTIDGKKYALSSFSVSTAAAQVPSITCGGTLVENSATTENSTTISGPAITLKKWHDAQNIGEAITLTGTGCHISACNLSLEGNITLATVDGTVVAHDISHGVLSAEFTIVQSGSTKPTVAAASGWALTSPLTVENPDEDYPSWKCTATKALESAHPISS